MKKIVYFLISYLFTITLASAQVRVGVVGSLQGATQEIKAQSVTLSGTTIIGFQAGVLVDAPLGTNFSLRPQVLYSVKGGKYDLSGFFGGSTTSVQVTSTINYIEVPVQLAYSLEVGSGRVILGTGPYVAYALNGTSKAVANGQSASEPLEFGSGEGTTKRIDYGLSLSAGYELASGLSITGYYSPGLANLANSSTSTLKNTSYGLSLAFLFGGN